MSFRKRKTNLATGKEATDSGVTGVHGGNELRKGLESCHVWLFVTFLLYLHAHIPVRLHGGISNTCLSILEGLYQCRWKILLMQEPVLLRDPPQSMPPVLFSATNIFSGGPFMSQDCAYDSSCLFDGFLTKQGLQERCQTVERGHRSFGCSELVE